MDQILEIAPLLEARLKSGETWMEFLRVPSLSMGLYVLAAGSDDPQEPHTEDEVYYVLTGRGSIRVSGASHKVAAGSLVFVPAQAVHRFHTIEEDLTLLVFFAPAEGSRSV
jgi:quercetin dioxygenase-like cupin family protein